MSFSKKNRIVSSFKFSINIDSYLLDHLEVKYNKLTTNTCSMTEEKYTLLSNLNQEALNP